MSDLPSHVEENIRTRRLLVRGQRLLVAVSGGVDSMVLLQVLHDLAPRHGWQLAVAHLNHALRGRSSDADERLVRRTAERLHIPARVERADVRGFAQAHKLSVEMAARSVRHQFLARTAAQLGISTVALAHQADDQLELFFLRLFRGSSGEGLAGMRWRNPSPSDRRIELIRPLLDQPRSALLTYATRAGIRFREDASNAWLDIQRNRIRLELLPLLRTKYQPALSNIIQRTADILGAEAEFAAQAASLWLSRQSKGKPASRVDKTPAKKAQGVCLDAPTAFEELPVAVQRRIIQLQLLRRGLAPDYSLIEELRCTPDKPVTVGPLRVPNAITSNLVEWAKRELDESEGRGPRERRHADTESHPATAIRDSEGTLYLQMREGQQFKSDSMSLSLNGKAGEAQFSGATIGWRIQRFKGIGKLALATGREAFDADRVGPYVLLRHWQPGDRFQPSGMSQPVKLQDFFTNQKVPPARRRRLIVAATTHGEVFWVEGMRISERFKLSKQTIRRLHWRWKRP